jgi:ribonuclease HII
MKKSLLFDHELELFAGSATISIGVDEVGRGCLAGPVVAGAVMFDWSQPEKIFDLAKRVSIHDSKTLSRTQRKESAAAIREVAIGVGIGQIDAREIDEINILQATLKAMKMAVECIPPPSQGGGKGEVCILVDGNQRIPNLDAEQETVIGGDAKIFSIAAASIVAKEYRDSMMEKFDEEFPGYNFSTHKGYGTKTHCEAIRTIGLSPLHRVTFWHG